MSAPGWFVLASKLIKERNTDESFYFIFFSTWNEIKAKSQSLPLHLSLMVDKNSVLIIIFCKDLVEMSVGFIHSLNTAEWKKLQMRLNSKRPKPLKKEQVLQNNEMTRVKLKPQMCRHHHKDDTRPEKTKQETWHSLQKCRYERLQMG